MTDLRQAAQMALEVLEQLQGGCTDSDDGTVEVITVWCPEVIDTLRAALAEPTYPLPDDLYPGSKDWAHGTYADRVEWLHTMYENAKATVDALAEQPAEQNAEHGEPVAWEWRWFDTSPYTVASWQWSDWKRVEPRNQLCTVEDSLNELRSYIDRGQRYELRALYTAPQPRKRLSNQEIYEMYNDPRSDAEMLEFARAIEAAHGIGETK